MGSSARVTNIQALTDFRPALIRFGENSQVAIRSTQSDASKVLGWLQRDRLPHWKRQIRIRAEEAVRANTKLIQQTTGDNPRPSVDARKAFELAKRRVREAEEKFERTKYWVRTLDKESVRYRASVQPMATLARVSLTAAIGRIDMLVNTLDAYTSLGVPSEEKSTHSIVEQASDDKTETESQEELDL